MHRRSAIRSIVWICSASSSDHSLLSMKIEWLSVEQQVAQELSVHPAMIRLYIQEGALPAVQLKRSYRINRKDLDDFLRRRYVDKAEE
jgi:excisionase family DNA binding protein